MAITAAKYTSMWSTSDTDADYLTSDEISEMTASFTNNDYINDKATLAMLGPVMHQIQKMQEELDYLRGLISNNKDKVTFPGFGTTSSTALAGNTTTISTAQANAITANTAKTTFPGLGTSSTTALAGDTKLVGIGSNTTLSFGDLTATTVKGKTTYTMVLQATRDFGGKTGLVTKSTTITLT